MGDNQGTISNSYATGNVEGGSDRVGGLVGRNHPVAAITNSYANGNVNGVGDYIGGLVGRNGGLITNGSATGNSAGSVEGASFVGGLAGANFYGEITSTYWNTEMNPDLDAVGFGEESGAVGYSSGQMMQQSSYVDWDFNDIWIITEGETYPWLRENPQDPPPSPDEPTNVAHTMVPDEYSLRQNYPNPFNPVTQIQFTLTERNDVVLEVFNLLGQHVATLVNNESLSEGHHTVTWNATNWNGETVSSGVYLYRLEAGSFIETKRMLYLKVSASEVFRIPSS